MSPFCWSRLCVEPTGRSASVVGSGLHSCTFSSLSHADKTVWGQLKCRQPRGVELAHISSFHWGFLIASLKSLALPCVSRSYSTFSIRKKKVWFTIWWFSIDILTYHWCSWNVSLNSENQDSYCALELTCIGSWKSIAHFWGIMQAGRCCIVAWNQPCWEYLHYRNWQTLKKQTFPLKS